MSQLSKGANQVALALAILHTLRINLKHLGTLSKRDQTLTPGRIRKTSLGFRKDEEECQRWNTFLVLKRVLENFDIRLTQRVQL